MGTERTDPTPLVIGVVIAILVLVSYAVELAGVYVNGAP